MQNSKSWGLIFSKATEFLSHKGQQVKSQWYQDLTSQGKHFLGAQAREEAGVTERDPLGSPEPPLCFPIKPFYCLFSVCVPPFYVSIYMQTAVQGQLQVSFLFLLGDNVPHWPGDHLVG